jgi:hypothetical protein
LSRMLSDRGTEFCGGDSHEYELYLAVEDIDHTRTKTMPSTASPRRRTRLVQPLRLPVSKLMRKPL